MPQIEFILKMWVDDKELESSQQFKIALKSTLKFIRGFPTFRMRQTFNSNKNNAYWVS